MKAGINNLWSNVSRIGLREGEDVANFREVILLNRLLFLVGVIMFFYLPVEIFFNDFQLVPHVMLMVVLFFVNVEHFSSPASCPPSLIPCPPSLKEIIPDKQPVGKHSLHRSFTTHTLSLEKGDCIYVLQTGTTNDSSGEKKGRSIKLQR